jgi:hypothetical protein
MNAVAITRMEYTVEELRALSARYVDGAQVRRILAIAMVLAVVLNLAVMFAFSLFVFPLFTSVAPIHSTANDSGKRPEVAVPRVPNNFHSPAMQLR